MNTSPQFTTSEAGGAQLQALNTLINCGWRYVTRAEADQWRDGRRTLSFLETQLRADLARINRIYLDERAYPFSEANIDAAVRRLVDRIPEGVVRANERMTDNLMLGIALPQTIGATSREWPLKFIDWSDWRANTFQVTSEYTVSEAGGPTIRVDLVLFVNGIPLGVIEVKASHVSSDQGVSQQIRNQKTGEGVPALFYSAQLLLAANSHDPRYGTVGTPRKLWSAWKEREDPAGFAVDVVNRPLDTVESKRVAIDFAPYMKRHNGLMEERRFVTPLDETIVGLCRPERFMRLVRRYMLFDGPQKKVARYQQIATIESLLKRTEIQDRVKRKGKWIFRELDRITNRPSVTPDRHFVSGETHLLLGKQYRLSIELADEPQVQIEGSRLKVLVQQLDDQAHCRRLITAFYAFTARGIFRERLDAMAPPFDRRGLLRPALVIRRMSKRWGSYTPKGRIVLNVDLVRASPMLIDYVICHELAHAFYPDHGKEWSNLLDTIMPDWEIRKACLEAFLR